MASDARTPVLVGFGYQGNGTPWQSIGDPVMGGQSCGTMEPVDNTTSVFRGEVSLANGGGFASVKADIPVVDLSSCSALRLRVCGDGKEYKLGLRMQQDRNAPVYQHGFNPEAGQWQTVELPFTDFIPRLRGRTLRDAPPVDASHIASVSLFISGGQEGAFALHLTDAVYGTDCSIGRN